jgi:hypothetical protein
MSKAPKNPSHQNDLKQRKNEGDVSRSKSTRKPRSSPKRTAEAVLDAVSVEISSGVMEAPQGRTVPSLPPVHDNAPASADSLMAAGNQIGENQQAPRSEIRDEAKQPVQAVTFADGPAPKEPEQGTPSNLPQPSEGVGMRADPKQEPPQHRPTIHDLPSESREDRKSWSRTGVTDTVQQVIRVWSPRLRGASDRVKGASGRVKVWAQERTARRAHESDEVQGSSNPVYLLAAITLGIPALLLIPLVGMNPGVQDGTFMTVLSFLVLSAFVTAVVFEIKRLVDQPPDENGH